MKHTQLYYSKENKGLMKRCAGRRGRWFSLKPVIACLLIAVSAASCDKYLDVKPEGELTGDELLKNAAGFEDALYGVYATLQKTTLYGENLSHNTIELLAQYFDCFGNDYVINTVKYNYKFSAVEAQLLNIWKDMYTNIANANNILKNLEHFSPETLRYYSLYKGEALGIRAFMHFDLLRLYTENIQLNPAASGIPYSTDFALAAPQLIPAEEVYQKIIADLTQAEELLKDDEQYLLYPKVINDENFLKDREIHFNLYAVQATLARVYFTKGDMPKALLYAEKVINSGKFHLMDKTEISAGLMKGVLFPKETIFGLYSNTYFTTVRNRFYYEISFFSYNCKDDTKTVFTGQEANEGHDFRWECYFKLPAVTQGEIRFTKLVDPYQLTPELEFQRPKGLIKGINMIRLPEMYYIAAEVLLDTDPEKGRAYLDVVLESRGLTALKNRTPAQPLTLDIITNERYKELIGEGQTFFNRKRLNMNFTDVNGQPVQASKAIYVLPIPLEEFDYRK